MMRPAGSRDASTCRVQCLGCWQLNAEVLLAALAVAGPHGAFRWQLGRQHLLGVECRVLATQAGVLTGSVQGHMARLSGGGDASMVRVYGPGC